MKTRKIPAPLRIALLCLFGVVCFTHGVLAMLIAAWVVGPVIVMMCCGPPADD